MTRPKDSFVEITPEVLLKAYSVGIFPMAESADDPSLYWVEPERRGIIPFDRFRISRRLARTVRADRFEIRVDRDFDAVIEACAAPAPGRGRHGSTSASTGSIGSCSSADIAIRSKPGER